MGTIITNIESAKAHWHGTDALIVADRIDNGAYISKDEYQVVLDALGRRQPPHLDLVDKLLYLPSLAREDAGRYTALMQTNAARYESADDAVATCQRNLGAVAMHPELSIHWGGDFEQKANRVTEEILHPESESESKYTLDPSLLDYDLAPRMIDAVTTMRLGGMAIRQSYHNQDGEEFRLRRILTDTGHAVYHYAVKTGQGSVRREVRRNLSQEQYELLQEVPNAGELHKWRERYLFEIGGGRQMVMSADFYDDRKLCALEIEGLDDTQSAGIDIPGFNKGGLPARELVQ